ncbi:MAG: 50S ribosomal protein L25/general stress protein Ctc, partial [Parasphingopyxis sp.]|uniref:50S ribosomal protein L25/general stress protein Ctc n=1 Tax=Parasphingopyxis sp. TaxID=1920299 RepID=UPI003F9F2C64
MSDQLTLSAEARERAGKGASRAMRREGRVPAVIYGDKKDPEPIHVEERALVKLLHTGHFMNSLVSLELGGSKTNALPKDVQFHPVTDRPMHVDFLRIGKGATVTLAVPVSFVNEEASPGLKRGGVLNVVRHELELTCPADDIPSEIVVALDGLEVGDSIHISQVELPE